MKHYKISISDQVYISLGDIFKHKSEYDERYASAFAEGCLSDFQNLSYLPHRGLKWFNKTGHF